MNTGHNSSSMLWPETSWITLNFWAIDRLNKKKLPNTVAIRCDLSVVIL